MTKKKVFWISLVGTVVFFTLSPSNLYGYCFQEGHCWRLWNVIESTAPYFFLLPLLLLFSIITYKMREEVFRSWIRFAYWWIPISLFLIYLAGGSSGGGFGMPNVLDQEFVSIILSGLFAIISLLVITWKYFATRGTPR